MQYTETLGIDVSKDTLDCNFYSTNEYLHVENNQKGFKKILSFLKKKSESKTLICFENTGVYSLNLATFLSDLEIPYVMMNALEIKRSMGIVRGKNDKIDAYRIAEYAYLRKDKLITTNLPSKLILKLQKLLSMREHFIKQRTAAKNFLKNLKEAQVLLNLGKEAKLFQKNIKELDQKIQKIEQQIMQEVGSDEQLEKLYNLLISIKGFGFVLAVNFIVTTNQFKSFDKPRKLACYAGIAPFQNQSGTSIRSKNTVSQLANKKFKSLLNMAAISAVQHDPDLKIYYNRKVQEGKSKMSVLNAVRNKLVQRAFAVVKRGTPYVIHTKYAA